MGMRTGTSRGALADSTFAGFRPAAFDFLRELAQVQNREWFQAHKATYDHEVRVPMAALVTDLTAELQRRGLPFQGDPKRSVFRINRDVRFSKDKRPYKAHASAALTRDGEKMSPGVLYIHLDPLGSFAAAGFFRPPPEALQDIREAVASRTPAYRHVVEELAKQGLVLARDEDALKRAPQGFEGANAPDILEALRRKSHIVRRPVADQEIEGPSLVRSLADFADAALPLLRFGWTALDG